MPTSKEDIASTALTLVGANPISAFTEDSNEARAADSLYEKELQDLLSTHPWRFAMKSQAMVKLAVAPSSLHEAAYPIPSDSIKPYMVHRGTEKIIQNVDVFGNEIHTYADTEFILDYTARVVESLFPPWFVSALEYRLAAVFAAAVAHNGELATYWESKASRKLMEAKHQDSMQDQPNRIKPTIDIIKKDPDGSVSIIISPNTSNKKNGTMTIIHINKV